MYTRNLKCKVVATVGALLLCIAMLSATPVSATAVPAVDTLPQAAQSESISIRVEVQRLPDTQVVDMTKGRLPVIRNAKVEVVEAGLASSTGPEGDVSFTVAPGDYTLRVTVPGNATTSSYKVSVVPFGQSDFTLFFNAQRDVNSDYTFRTLQKNRVQAPVKVPRDSGAQPKNTSGVSLASGTIGPMSIPIEPAIPATISVYWVDQAKTLTYGIEDYVKKVLAGEIGLGFYQSTSNSYLTSTQELTLFSAKAIAVRTYGAFHAQYYGCASTGPEAINDTNECQVVNHTFTGTATDNINQAVTNTRHKILIYIRDFQAGYYEDVDAVFFASSSGQTRSAASLYPRFYPTDYLQSETDTYDPEASTWICNTKPGVGFCEYNEDEWPDTYRLDDYYAGHGVGMSQDGSAGWAKHGSSYTWIVTHYYRGTSIYTASTY